MDGVSSLECSKCSSVDRTCRSAECSKSAGEGSDFPLQTSHLQTVRKIVVRNEPNFGRSLMLGVSGGERGIAGVRGCPAAVAGTYANPDGVMANPGPFLRPLPCGCTTRKWQGLWVPRTGTPNAMNRVWEPANSFVRACLDAFRRVGRHAQAALGVAPSHENPPCHNLVAHPAVRRGNSRLDSRGKLWYMCAWDGRCCSRVEVAGEMSA